MGLVSVTPPVVIISGFFSVSGEQLHGISFDTGFPASLAVVNDYYEQQMRTLERISREHMSIKSIQQYRDKPAELWPLILTDDPRGICYQVFRVIDEDYSNQKPLFGIGDSHYFLRSSPQNTLFNGLLPRSLQDEPDLVRYVTTGYIRDELLICVYTSSFVPGFDYVRENLQLNYEKSRFREKIEQNFTSLGILLYALALIPGMLFFILIAYLESVYFSSPLSLLFEYLGDASGGQKNRILLLDSLIYRDVIPVIQKRALYIDLPPVPEGEKYSLNALLVEVRELVIQEFPGNTLELHFCQPDWFLLVPETRARHLLSSILNALFSACPAVSVSARNVRRGSLPFGRLIINWSSAIPSGGPFSRPEGRKALLRGVLTEAHMTMKSLNGYVYFLEEDDESGVCFIDFPARTE
ncbi:MAG: hypothetical protein LBR47_01005, partial [Spirochaetaceae bacterium]|jgi:hypothetical protein|nr:hypothetical protein [Spirochaetaceae bacterium]